MHRYAVVFRAAFAKVFAESCGKRLWEAGALRVPRGSFAETAAATGKKTNNYCGDLRRRRVRAKTHKKKRIIMCVEQ